MIINMNGECFVTISAQRDVIVTTGAGGWKGALL